MNLFGKIFTLLIFFMSITFLVLAVMVGATHRDWKSVAKANKLKATSTQNKLDATKTATNETKKKLNAEQVSRQQQLAQLFSELQVARTRHAWCVFWLIPPYLLEIFNSEEDCLRVHGHLDEDRGEWRNQIVYTFPSRVKP